MKVYFNGDIRSRKAIFSIFECNLLQYIIKADLMQQFFHADDLATSCDLKYESILYQQIWGYFGKKSVNTYKLQHTGNANLI